MPAVVLSRQNLYLPKKEVIFWIRYLSGPAEVYPKRKEKNGLALKKDCSEVGTPQGRWFLDTVGDTAAEAFIEHGVPWLAKQGVRQGRYFASEFLREPEYQKKIANKAKPILRGKLLITPLILCPGIC